tara:strand:+ start:750 stop:1220 length:471 start_codon:yes stop_codon:yes gene_type:complete
MKLLILFIVAFTVLGCSSDSSSPIGFIEDTQEHVKAFSEAQADLFDVFGDPNNMRYDLLREQQREVIRVADEIKTELNEVDVPKQCINLRDTVIQQIDEVVQLSEDIVYAAETGEVTEFLESNLYNKDRELDVGKFTQISEDKAEDYFNAIAECES